MHEYYEYGLRVAWVDDTYHSTTAWQRLCDHARARAEQQDISLNESLRAVLSELDIDNPPGDDNIYFKTEADRLMFVLRWA